MILLGIVKKHAALELERFLEELEAAAGVPLGGPRSESWPTGSDVVGSRAGAQGGGHGRAVAHPHAPGAADHPRREVTADLRTSRSILESQIDAPVYALAVPGRQADRGASGLRRAVRRAGIRLGLTTRPGSIRLERSLDWLGIPRVTVERGMTVPFFRSCLAFPQMCYS
jgi:hypothetical protein